MKTRLLLICLLLLTIESHSQWVQTNGPMGGHIKGIVTMGNNIFVGADGAGVFHSDTIGSSWTHVNNGFPIQLVKLMALSDTTIYAGTSGALYRSSDMGVSWSGIYNAGNNITAIAANDSIIVTGTQSNGIYISLNSGTSWAQANNGLTTNWITGLTINGLNIFASTTNGVFLSTDYGASWVLKNNGIPASPTVAIWSMGSEIYVSSAGSIFKTTNNGGIWYPASSGILGSPKAFASDGNAIYAATSLGVCKTINGGTTWVEMNNGLTDIDVLSIAVSGSKIYAGTNGGGVFQSVDGAVSWTAVNSGLIGTRVEAQHVIGTDLFAGGHSLMAWLSLDKGNSWNPVNSGIELERIVEYANDGTVIIAGAETGYLFRSMNNGASWTEVTIQPISPGTVVTGLCFIGNILFVSFNDWGPEVWRSSDYGDTWEEVQPGLPFSPVTTLHTNGVDLYVGTADSGVYRSDNLGYNWMAANSGLPNASVQSIVYTNGKLYAASVGVYRSNDNGNTWIAVNSGLNTNAVKTLVAYGDIILAGTLLYGVYISTDFGNNWYWTNSNFSSQNTYSLAIIDSTVFAGINNSGIFKNNTILCNLYASISPMACDSYTTPSGNHTWTSSGTCIDIIQNSVGCDSNIVINLTVNSSPVVTVSAAGATTFCQGDSVILSATPGMASYQWYRWNSAIAGATFVDYVAKSRGKYKCIALNAGLCADTSNSITVNVPCIPVGPNQQRSTAFIDSNLQPMQIFPNPGTGKFVIESLPGQLQVFNSIGRLILSNEILDDETTLDISEFADGIYFVILRSGDMIYSDKIIMTR